MDFLSLIPVPDTIPARALLFLVLDIFLFTVHILLINMLLGSGLITIFTRMKKGEDDPVKSLHGPAVNKIPALFAIGINMGVAPLLFIQVIYGNLFYTSSVLMAVYWILVIPFLILAYYGAYIHSRRYTTNRSLSRTALWITVIMVLYIGFMLVNNNTLMVQPEKWTAYFENRGGTILNLGEPSLLPRYLHFVTASVAVGGLFLAFLWSRSVKNSDEGTEEKVKSSLEIFAWATIVQILIGCWFLISLPRDIMMNFMGKNLPATAFLVIAVLCALGAVFMALKGKLRPVISMILITIIAMIINRQLLRGFYLEGKFSLGSLQLSPQYGVFTLFLIILITGLATVGYMLRISCRKNDRRII
jgi:hypothetical protein